MAVLAISAIGAGIGAAIGGTFLGMSATGIGWSLGSMAGNMFFGPKGQTQEGPRLGDLKVSASTYGNPIPKVYGAYRIAGNMIWSTPIVETRHKKKVGGGKGGSKKSTQITYTYAQSFAIALCEGEIAGVRKIWANGKLIYNAGETADIPTIAASNQLAKGITFYTGSETQTANSLIQANIGVADTPAYRGIAYVVFTNLQLANYGNRAPNLEFEIIGEGGYTSLVGDKTDYFTQGSPVSGLTFDPITNSIWKADGTSGKVAKMDVYTGTEVEYTTGGAPLDVTFDPITKSVWAASAYTDIYKINIFSGLVTAYSVTGGGANCIEFDSETNSVWAGQYTGIVRVNIDTGEVEKNITLPATPMGLVFDPITESIWILMYSVGLCKMDVHTGDYVIYSALIPPSWANASPAFDPVTRSVWVPDTQGGGPGVSKVNIFNGTFTFFSTPTSPSFGLAFDPLTEAVWSAQYGDGTVAVIDIQTGASSSYSTGTSPCCVEFDSSTNSIWVLNSGSNSLSKVNIFDYGMASTSPSLAAIVADICISAGLDAGDIDVTDLTGTVHGYAITRNTGRSQLQQLMQAYYFDAVESDGKIKFVTRGGASVVTIEEADLAAHEYGSASPVSLTITRAHDMELPCEVAINFPDSSAAYQISAQTSRRLTTQSENKISHNLAIAMSATKGKEVSDVLLYDAWMGRTTLELLTGWKYAYLEPTDVVTAVSAGRSYLVRLVDEDAQTGIFRRIAVLEESAVYTQTASAAEAGAQDESVASVVRTNCVLMDIPLMRDQDDGIGFYAAAAGYGAGWTGAQLYKSSDGGLNWTAYGDGFLADATLGVALTVLTNFTRNIFDETGTVSVLLQSGSLESDTEINVLNGANFALLGDEIIQFKTATLTAADTYTLSGLLRGRRGTEWAASTHVVSERFVLLDIDSIYLLTGPSSEYDIEREYRAVTFDDWLDDTYSFNFTNTAVALIPYSPVELGGGRNPSLDLTITWKRRTRIGGDWNSYSDVPLGEATEAYEVDIYTASDYVTVVRTITGITTPTTVYLVADQTTDFGSARATVYFIVYQISATVGRGYPARGVK